MITKHEFKQNKNDLRDNRCTLCGGLFYELDKRHEDVKVKTQK